VVSDRCGTEITLHTHIETTRLNGMGIKEIRELRISEMSFKGTIVAAAAAAAVVVII
jgi:hypothetical protein